MKHHQLSGSISSELGKLTLNLFLVLYNDQSYGSIYLIMGNINSLNDMDLSNNQLSNNVPSKHSSNKK